MPIISFRNLIDRFDNYRKSFKNICKITFDTQSNATSVIDRLLNPGMRSKRLYCSASGNIGFERFNISDTMCEQLQV